MVPMKGDMTVGTLAAIDQSGDTKAIWDPRNTDEVAAARKTFTDLKAKGYMAYKLRQDGEPGELLRDFDPEAAQIIMRPRMQGG